MRNSRLSTLALAAGLAFIIVPWASPASSSGIAGHILALDLGTPEGPGALQNAGFLDCSVATPGLTCYDLVSPAMFTSMSFAGYTVLFVGWTEGAAPAAINALYARAADIDAFVSQGGGLVAFSEYPLGQWTWIPGGSALSYAESHGDDVTLTVQGQTHPAYAGQTSATLSGWGSSYHNVFLAWPAYLQPLATDGSGTWTVTLGGSYGTGCAFITGQDPDWHSVYGTDPAATPVVQRAVNWASGCGVTPPIPTPGKVLLLDLGTPEAAGSLQKAGVQPCASSPAGVLCYDLLGPSAFQATALGSYSVLFVGWTYTGYGGDAAALAALNARAADISAWVSAGGAVVALAEFDPSGVPSHWTWIPNGALPPVGYVMEHADDVVVPLAAHPVYAGQTTSTVSGWENARHNYFTSWPSYLSSVATDGSGSKVVSLAGTFGAGCVFVTGQDPDWHAHYADNVAATLMIRNAVTWAAQC